MDPVELQKKEGTTKSVLEDLELLGVTWEEALDLTGDRSEWRNCTARCATTARGRTKV